MGKYIVGITGASGAIYGHRLIEHLKTSGHIVHLICTDAGKKVSDWEGESSAFKLADEKFKVDNFFAPPASGSSLYDGMIVAPCSVGTMAKIACGIGDNLLTRSADVCIKEKVPLIIVPREAPLSGIHLNNMQSLVKNGVHLIPASPHFYHRPKTIEDLVDTVLSRVLDHLKVQHNVGKRWGESE